MCSYLNSFLESCNNPSTFEIAGFVVDVVGVIATVAAVIVALVANSKASKSMEYSLKIQEQSKNIDLFEKRVTVLNEIIQSNNTLEIPLQLLFNDKIYDGYKALRVRIMEADAAAYDMNIYQSIMLEVDGEGGYTSPVAELIDFEHQLEESDYPEDRVKEFEQLCAKYQITYSETGNPDDAKVYNYKVLSKKMAKADEKVREHKSKLVSKMKLFIEQSISPIKEKN